MGGNEFQISILISWNTTNMENNTILEFIVNILGLGILLWFLSVSVIDLIKHNRHKSVFHNLVIIGICLVCSLKILLKDLLSVV
jgi:hypothetical protein